MASIGPVLCWAWVEMTTARAELAAFDDGILRADPGGTKDLRLKQDVQYWAACSLIAQHGEVAFDLLQRSRQPDRPASMPAGLVCRDTVPTMRPWPLMGQYTIRWATDTATGPFRRLARPTAVSLVRQAGSNPGIPGLGHLGRLA